PVDGVRGWSCPLAGATLSCSGSLASGATVIFTVHAQVNSSAVPSFTQNGTTPPALHNRVTITSTATGEPALKTANNFSLATTPVAPRSSDLPTTKTIGPNPTAPLPTTSEDTNTITTTNTGPTHTDSPPLNTDPLPPA